MYEFEELPLPELKEQWDALPQHEKDAYIDDYQFQIVSSHHDAGDHVYHRILGG